MSALIRRGNDETNNRLSYFDIKIWDDLVLFSKDHQTIFIFGEGNIGKALAFYFTEAEIPYEGHLSSDSLQEFKKRYIKGKSGIVLGLTDWYYSDILSKILSFVDISDVFFIPETEKQFVKNQFSLSNIEDNFWITVYATYHCNLNCKSCLTHSPICKAEFYNYRQYVQDIQRIEELGVSIHRINFSGGEPFLHPQIMDMFKLARKEFSTVPTTCFTNGSLLHRLSSAELAELADMKVELAITEYPVPSATYHSNLAMFNQQAEQIGLQTQIIFDEKDKLFYKHPFHLAAEEPKHNFINCHRFRNCYMLCLYNGKLWKCYNAPNADNFNKTFGTNIKTSKNDFIDLNDNITELDIYNFCRKRTPFCSYCKPLKDTIPWGFSERKIEEWT